MNSFLFSLPPKILRANRIQQKVVRTMTSLHYSPHVLPSRSSNVGVFTLNKPSSLNALTLDMVRSMNSVLPVWQQDPTLLATLVEGSHNERTKKPVFCAGGDVKAIALDGLSTESKLKDQGYGIKGKLSADFFREEYQLNYSMAIQQSKFQKPQISLWDGVVMGGGVGISIHGAYRVATENTMLAMPETAIGLFPDVGATYWLSRMEKSEKFKGLGMFLALSGWRLRPNDLLFAHIATHYIHSSKLADLKTNLFQRVKTSDDVKVILDEFHENPSSDLHTLAANKNSECFLEKNIQEIKDFFSNSDITITVPEIFRKLSQSNSTFAQTMSTHLRKMSPTSLVATAECIKRASKMNDIQRVLEMEYRLSQGFMRHCGPPSGDGDVSADSDFYEGIRAVLIEKDHKPNWNPKSLNDVDSQQIIDRFFKEDVLKEEPSLSSNDEKSSKL